ncbi:MAG: sortase, partial [Clostridium sp.]
LKIDRLAEGDEIKVTTLDGTVYTYNVTNSFVVQPQDTYILEESDKPIVTLVTCTYDGSERLIVQGTLTGRKDKAE